MASSAPLGVWLIHLFWKHDSRSILKQKHIRNIHRSADPAKDTKTIGYPTFKQREHAGTALKNII